MDADDELAALRARAYAAGAPGLTAPERDRLRELEAHRRGTPAPSEPEVAAPLASAAAASTADYGAPAAPGSVPEPPVDPAPAPARTPWWSASRVPLVAVVVLVVLGTILGAVIGSRVAPAPVAAASPTPTATATPLTISDRPVADVAGSRTWALGIVPWDDPDALTLLGGAGDVLVWWGTISDGSKTCIAVDAGDWGVPRCDDTDHVRAEGITLDMTVVRTLYDVSGLGTATPRPADAHYTVAADPYRGRLFVWGE